MVTRRTILKTRDVTWTDKDGLTHTLRGYGTTTCGISSWRELMYTTTPALVNCLGCLGNTQYEVLQVPDDLR